MPGCLGLDAMWQLEGFYLGAGGIFGCFLSSFIKRRLNLKQGNYSMCSGCRKPVSQKERKSLKYVEGISCPKCHDHITHEQKSRFAMRQKQILLAKKSGKRHIFQKEF